MIKRILRDAPKVYLSTQPVDMRKQINGLAAIVQNDFDLDLYDRALFVFSNRQHDKVKILEWDKDGFVLYYKRREKGRFSWPSKMPLCAADEITQTDLKRLLDGLLMERYIEKKNWKIT